MLEILETFLSEGGDAFLWIFQWAIIAGTGYLVVRAGKKVLGLK